MTKPLSEATQRGEREPLLWERMQRRAFEDIKQALLAAPGSGSPDIPKPFLLNVMSLLVWQWEDGPRCWSWQRPAAFLYKQADSVAQGWPPCRQALTATVLSVSEADALTLGQELTI